MVLEYWYECWTWNIPGVCPGWNALQISNKIDSGSHGGGGGDEGSGGSDVSNDNGVSNDFGSDGRGDDDGGSGG